MSERIQKIISASGYCSRRAAEELIAAGRVSVNGKTAGLGESALPGDRIEIDGKPLRPPDKKVYIMLNKPRGYVTTMSDDRGRKTVTQLVTDVGVRVYPIGRLDMDSEGLLLMTNDGALAHRLMHPSHEVEKTYNVRVKGGSLPEALEILRSPLELDGRPIVPAKVIVKSEEKDSALLSLTISEGRNRQIRRMCAMANLSVLRLKRVTQGPISLGELPTGKWRFLRADEIDILQKL